MNEYFEYGGKRFVPQGIPVATRPLWRVRHDAERPENERVDRPNLPEVYRLQPNHHVIFTEPMQRLWYRLNYLLTGLDPLLWRKLGGNALYLFNGGHGFPGHADYVNGLELDKPDPRAPQMLVCGGAIVTGTVEGDRLYLEGIDTREPLPNAETVIENRWYYTNVTVQADLSIGRFPQGDGKDTFTPLFYGNPTWRTERVWLPLADLDAIAAGGRIPGAFEVPSPYG